MWNNFLPEIFGRTLMLHVKGLELLMPLRVRARQEESLCAVEPVFAINFWLFRPCLDGLVSAQQLFFGIKS